MTVVSGVRDWWRRQRQANADRAAAITAIRTSDRFRAGLDTLAQRHERDGASVAEDAMHYLDEMVTVHSDALPDFNLVLSRIADRRGFEGVVQYQDQAVERLRSCNDGSSLVMLTGHRSYLDFVVRVPFAQSGFAREFRFAGANNLYWPIDTFGHNTGIIFIRRGHRDPVYTYVLRHYVGWLTERGANFLWALEGGRSRTGKLLPPKAGLLAYVADAYADGRADDVTLVPATVVYEYLHEVYEYARYGRGASKSGENLLFAVRLVGQVRRVPPEARIHVGVGEPVSLAAFADADAGDAGDGRSASIERMALEVSRRIEAATPITGVALVLLVLLERDAIRLRLDELVSTLHPVVADIGARALPAPEAGIGGPESVDRALRLLTTQGLVTKAGAGADAIYYVRPGRHLEAAYYRNAIVHFFAIQSIVELALAMTAAADVDDAAASFWRSVGDLRELLDREFFFPEGGAFTEAVRAELCAQCASWEAILASADGAEALIDRLPQPFLAPRALASFLEAHTIVSDGLRRLGSRPVVDDGRFLLDCLARAELDLELGRLHRRDAASLNMLEPALKAADGRGLAHGAAKVGRERRAQLLAEAMDAVVALETRNVAVTT